MEAIKTSVTNSPAESEVKGKAVKKSGKRIGYNYIILKSLKESQKNDVVKCLYIKSLTNFGICVIKEGTYGDSKDKQGRDIKDRLIWQKQLHESLQGKVRLPRLLGSFEENGNYYLVLERIRGKSLHKACKEAGRGLRDGLITGNKLGMKFLDYMIQMIELLEILHKNGIVHRDVTATNFMITPAGKVAVIDMELSYSLDKGFPDPPFQLGTHGYMSPEQEATKQPSTDQDTFSAAAILLQIWTGIWPTKLTIGSPQVVQDRVRFFIPDKAFADTIINCLDNNPSIRPSLAEVHKVIVSYKNSLKSNKSKSLSSSRIIGRDEILETTQKAIKTLSSPLMADPEKGWFSENSRVPLNPDKRKINKAWYTSFYSGACGVIYLLSKANMLGFEVEASKPYVEKGLDLVSTKYISKIETANSGFYFGGSGIAAAIAGSIREGLISPQTFHFDWINQLLEKENALLTMQNGIAGQGMAHLLSHPFLNNDKIHDKLSAYVNRLIDEQEKDGSWIRVAKNKKNKTTRGFANGSAGIIYFLLEYAGKYNDSRALESAELGLHWLMKKAIRQRGAIQWRSSEKKEIDHWWCEGAPGIALAFMKAYSLTHSKHYQDYATGALRNHNMAATDNNLSQSRGISGLGEIYLQAFQIFEDEEWLKRAEWIAQYLVHLKKEHSIHGPFWLVENEREPVADFMIGNSGVIHFLLRYCYNKKMSMPLLL